MKKAKIKTEHKVLDEKIAFVHYEWKFSEDEKKEIRKILQHRASSQNIENFIQNVQGICNGKKLLLKQEENSEIRLERQKILNSLKSALKNIQKIRRGKAKIYKNKTLDFEEMSFFLQIFDASNKADLPLVELINVIQEFHDSEIKKTGRKKADSDNFIKEIADAFRKDIQEPSSYKYGPFFEIIETILSFMGLPSSDPSRAVKAALQKK